MSISSGGVGLDALGSGLNTLSGVTGLDVGCCWIGLCWISVKNLVGWRWIGGLRILWSVVRLDVIESGLNILMDGVGMDAAESGL